MAPGFIDTDMTRALIRRSAYGAVGSHTHGAPRLGHRYRRNGCCFSALDPAGYITGQTLHVNGGMYMP